MKASEFRESLLECSKPVLAGAVKLSQRKQLVDADGKNWHDWVQAQPTGKKLSDPRRYSVEQLADFLASLSSQKPDPRAPGKELVKPRKLLKRYLPWLTDRIQHDKAAGSGGDAAAAGGKKHKGKKQPAAAAQGSADADGAVKDQQAAAKADPVWQLMQRTRSHPRFHHWYTFDSYEKGWVTSGRPEAGSDAAAGRVPSGAWRLLGVDCEMCATSDNDKELLQVAVVDEHGSLLMQELVMPGSPVVDCRTALTGISAADLEGVTLTRKAAAKRVAKLLSPTTVLVGHGLHHDLQALKLDHPWVIDTSMIFEFKGLSSFVPSLALLSEQLLGQPLRGRDPSAPLSSSQQQPQHDSREDASVALALVKLELQRGAASAPLDPPDLKVDKADLCKLCVHKLPAGTTSSSLEATAASVKASLAAACRQAGAEAEAAAVESAAVEQPGDTSKQLLFLVFQHAGLANEVFAALPGWVFTDSVGRHSKRQTLQGRSHKVVVRKMACHAGLAFGKDKAADRGVAKHKGSSSSKKRKAPGAGGGKRPKAAGKSKRPKQK